MSEPITSLIYDLQVRGDSKWHKLTEPQKAKFIEAVFAGATIEKLLKLFSDAMAKNVATGDKTCAGEMWSVRGVSEFRDALREARQQMLTNARIASSLVGELVEVEKQTGRTMASGGLKVIAAAYSKLAHGAVNSDKPEGRAMLTEAKQALVEIRHTEQRDEEREDRRQLKTRELDQRDQTKIEAGLKQIEREVGKNPVVRQAVETIRATIEDGSGAPSRSEKAAKS